MKRLRPARLARRAKSLARDFLADGAAGGVVLMAAAALALVVANSPFGSAYATALAIKLGPLSLLHWINDGLMALFFLLVGLEIKREVLDGQLRQWSERALPAAAALGGMVVPATLYLAIVAGDPTLARGWAIPAATDIAFALGVMALLGPRVPVAAKLLLTAVAIIDDLGAILIIAVAYTEGLNLAALAGAAGAAAVLVGLNRLRITRVTPYLMVGGVLWALMLVSGVHATLAGVITALSIPLNVSPGRPDAPSSPLHRLEHGLSPWVAFGVVPVFGFVNAGLDLSDVAPADVAQPLPLGIAVALLVGKPVGVLTAIAVAVRLRVARPPAMMVRQLAGTAALCGIGFTMSLFIAGLAFGDAGPAADSAKLGILAGSVLSAALGAALLAGPPRRMPRRPSATWPSLAS